MPRKIYIVELTSQERNQLKRMINTSKTAAYKQRYARILLLTNQNSKAAAMKDDDIAKVVGCGRVTVEQIRKRFVEEGLQEALARHKSLHQY